MNFIFYLALLFLILIFGTLDNNIDFDFWARLIVGKSFFQTGSLFTHDFYSYGRTHEFIDHEWGSSLIFYLIQNNFNDIGLFIFKSIIIFVTFLIIVKTIQLDKKDIKLHILFFFFAIQSISYNIFSTIRCQTFSFLFFVAFIYILKYVKITKNYRVLWTLPILNIIWANCHGGFVIGIAIIVLFTLGEYLNNNKKFAKYLLITLTATLFSSLINPYGIKYLTYIIDAFRLDRTHITEWKSAFFYKLFTFYLLKFKIFFFSAMAFFITSICQSIKKLGIKDFYKKIDKTKYLIIIFSTLISLKSLRCHVFFTYSILIFCYCDFYQIFNKKLPNTIDNLKEIILTILIGISCISHIYNYKFINTLRENDYPYQCVEFIKENNLKGNVFAIFHSASYVIYKLYPNNYIFMDGRYEEVYNNELVNQMGSVFLAKNQDKFFKIYHNDILILDKKYPIVEALKSNKNWFIAFEDKHYALFLPKELKNRTFKTPAKDKDYYFKTKFKTNINWLN